MSTITVTAVLRAKAGKEQQLREELLKVVPLSRKEAGCIEYNLHQSLEDQRVFLFYETWKDEEALKSHAETEHYQQYRQNTEPLLESREVYRVRKLEL
ncbi:putative quinol monooxygenase [Brevibacillus fulvus]|uniref:Quinol monooxygenase YgiN n=1 Tax=Brevibacillus fulvus TaxID=1125967 RepID=A0A938XZB3_9BACL|nr:putative quinol monooxygenase [Brevibacillus fulvus]MBM7590368.1 quinol monooxygenase YgiN [Brevibacillus fulvus]